LRRLFAPIEGKVVLFEEPEALEGLAAGIREGRCGAGTSSGLTALGTGPRLLRSLME